MDILKYNKQCVELLGYINTTSTDKDFNIYEHPETKHLIETNSCNFFTENWDWIMKVVEKIESLKFNSSTCTNASPRFTLGNCFSHIHINNDRDLKTFLPKGGSYYYWSLDKHPIKAKNRKEATILAIQEFLNSYNNEKDKL